MKKSTDSTDPTPVQASPGRVEPPAEFPMPLLEFAQTYSPGRDVELMGGFLHHARQAGWVQATRTEWAERFEAFRVRPAGA